MTAAEGAAFIGTPALFEGALALFELPTSLLSTVFIRKCLHKTEFMINIIVTTNPMVFILVRIEY